MQMNKIFVANKSLPAVAHVGVRGRIVQVPIRHPCLNVIVPVTTELGKHAS